MILTHEKKKTCCNNPFFVHFQLLFGNILSVEDHGYRMDLGIKGLQAFLTTKDAEQFIKTKFNGEMIYACCWLLARCFKFYKIFYFRLILFRPTYITVVFTGRVQLPPLVDRGIHSYPLYCLCK